MKIDMFLTEGLATAPAQARRAEDIGYDAVWSAEVAHDPLLPLAAAAGVTSRIQLGTSIALAFARSPMSLAYQAWDLAAASEGRFVLGLGTQVKAHIARRTTLPPDVVYNAYGITESLLHTCLWPQDAATHSGSVGQAVPGVLLRVVDGDRRTVPAGTVGEIAACAPTIATTYLGNSGAWDAVTFVEDGRTWYLSGDLGRMDEDGFLYIVDRVKDMVIPGGENVYSAEVEKVLAHVPGVAEVAVVGVPDQRWGECVTAVVVRAPESTLDEAQLLAGCDDGLAPYKRPRRVHFVDSLPRTRSARCRSSSSASW
jgi:fatty-acyl-CoA synthase